MCSRCWTIAGSTCAVDVGCLRTIGGSTCAVDVGPLQGPHVQ